MLVALPTIFAMGAGNKTACEIMMWFPASLGSPAVRATEKRGKEETGDNGLRCSRDNLVPSHDITCR